MTLISAHLLQIPSNTQNFKVPVLYLCEEQCHIMLLFRKGFDVENCKVIGGTYLVLCLHVILNID